MTYKGIVKAQLRIDEGWRNKPYRDTVGKLTIAVGRNLDDVGLREDEISYLLENDVCVAENDARTLFHNFDALSDERKAVLINMAFNLGRNRLSAFARMRTAVESSNFAVAAIEMMDSAWARQVGPRAVRLSQKMREG